MLDDCAPLDWRSDDAGDARRGVSEAFRRDTKCGATQRNKIAIAHLQVADILGIKK